MLSSFLRPSVFHLLFLAPFLPIPFFLSPGRYRCAEERRKRWRSYNERINRVARRPRVDS